MTGKTVDRCAAFLLRAFLFYIFFLNAWRSIPLASICAFVCCIFWDMVIRKRPRRYRLSRAQAAFEIMRIACTNDAEGQAAIENLMRLKYPREDFDITCLLRHPSSTISEGDVFTLWKKHSGLEKLVIAATCPASPRAIIYAREFTSPRLCIADSRSLMRIIRETGAQTPTQPRAPLSRRLRFIPQRLFGQRLGIRHGLWAMMLIGIYLLLGNPLYLFLGLIMLFMLGVSLINCREKKRLF